VFTPAGCREGGSERHVSVEAMYVQYFLPVIARVGAAS